MAITSSNPLTLSASTTFANVAVGLQITPRFTATGVTASVILSAQLYRALTDGSAQKIGDATSTFIADVFSAAATDPTLAAALSSIQSAIQTYITAKRLI